MKRLARGELEAQVMDLLWDANDWLTPREVQASVATRRRPLTYNTVMTILVRLWQKGMLEREVAGRGFAYRPVTTRDEWAAQRMHELFHASRDPLLTLHHFVDAISAREASQLRRVLDKRRKR